MEPNGYQFPQIVISSGEKQLWPDGALAANTPLGRTLLLDLHRNFNMELRCYFVVYLWN